MFEAQPAPGKSAEELQRRTPEVVEAREFLEITRDFTDPKEAIREAISNSLDWGAKEIRVRIYEDKKRPDDELIIEIRDDGLGLNEERLHAFFDLGHATGLEYDEFGNKKGPRIGEKGHGTKTYFNSRLIEVWSDSEDCTVYAVMDSPLEKLLKEEVPDYGYAVQDKENRDTGTTITIRGYNNNQKKDFGHAVLKDYIVWFTKFGSVEREFGVQENAGKVLFLKGLGRELEEQVDFGHVFAPENSDVKRLMKDSPGDWTKRFVKRWRFQDVPVNGFPGAKLDFLLYVEGDIAKREYNQMIRSRGKTPQYGMYKVEDKYGLLACKDYIPIQQYNEWLALGTTEWTKYHAFVNCQEFRLTANRGEVTNTPRDLLEAIKETVSGVFWDKVKESSEYKEYEDAAELEEQYRDASQERQDFVRRQKLALQKKTCKYEGVELVEPRQEAGVVAVFYTVSALRPDLFPFHVVDYDARKGYDALAAERTVLDLNKDTMYFVEFKYKLGREFNHSFSHLAAVVCWDSALSDGAEVVDIENNRRELRISRPDGGKDHTTYMLLAPTEKHNIEVYVLRDFLREKLKLDFRPRASS